MSGLDKSYLLVAALAAALVVPTHGEAARTPIPVASAAAAATAAATMATAADPASYCKKDQGCDYLESWAVQAVRLQNHIDVDAPIKRAVLPHSHNAFNAKKDGYHTDPNHVIGVKRQLETGVRSLAYDIGAYPSRSAYQSTHSIRLCHKVCSDADVFLGEGLRTLRDYIESDEGKDEVLFLQIELNMPPGNKGDYVNDIRKKIVDELGDYIYRPPGGACSDWNEVVAQSVTKAAVRAAGKNIVINGAKGCYNDKFQSWVFKGTWSKSVNFGTDQPSLSPYPSCVYGTKFTAADIQADFFRSFNDGTALGVIDTGSQSVEVSSLSADQMEKARGCGVNALGPEPLDDWMGRWKAQVWSWDEDEPAPPFGRYGRGPADNANDCALHSSGGRFSDASCGTARRFACQHPDTRAWKITSASKAWSQGAATCTAEYGSDGYVFAVPVNGYENNQLVDAKLAAGVARVWLHYSDISREGEWRVGAPVATPADPPKLTQMLAGGDWNGSHFTTSIAFGDVDGDGLDEVGVTRNASSGDRWWIFDDAAHDFAQLRSGGGSWNSDYYATAIAFGDVDGDGLDEVGLARKASGNDRYWIFDDAGQSFKTLHEGGGGWNDKFYVTALAFGDVDGDGRDEIGLTREANDNGRFFILDDKAGSFATLHEGGRSWNSKNRATTIAFGDVDGDGRDEVGIGRKADSGARYIVYDDQKNGFKSLHEGGKGWNSSNYPTAIAFGNVDGDARAELGLTRNSDSNDRFWVLDDAKASFATLAYGGSGWGSNNFATGIAFGDIDGDGRDEVGVSREASSHGRFFIFEDSGGQFKLVTEGGSDWNDKADGKAIAFGKTFDNRVDIGVGRSAPDNARYFVLGWN